MSLITICGDVGSGKTTLATTLALMYSGPNIYANYNIKLPNASVIEPEDLWTLHNGLVILDEIYEWADSRTSGKHINRYISQLIFKSRKRDLDIISICQLFSTEDKRIREMSELVIVADDAGDRFDYYVEKQSIMHPKKAKFSLSKRVLDTVGPYFDTYEDHEIPYDLIGDSILDSRSLLPDVAKWADTIKNPKDYTIAACENLAMYNNKSKRWARMLYGELKGRAVK